MHEKERYCQNLQRYWKDIGKNPHAVASCQIYKECEIRITPNNVNQDERTRLNKVRETSENTLDIKPDLVEYITDCSKEQQQILSIDNCKNQKLLIVPIKSKKDTVTESRLVTLEKKKSYQQLETSTITITTFRSNTKEDSVLSINEELQLDNAFTHGNLKKNVKHTNTKDKGKQLQSKIFQIETCMKTNNTVITYKDIGKNPHVVVSCQNYKEYETSIPEPNNINQDERIRLK